MKRDRFYSYSSVKLLINEQDFNQCCDLFDKRSYCMFLKSVIEIRLKLSLKENVERIL